MCAEGVCMPEAEGFDPRSRMHYGTHASPHQQASSQQQKAGVHAGSLRDPRQKLKSLSRNQEMAPKLKVKTGALLKKGTSSVLLPLYHQGDEAAPLCPSVQNC